MSTENNGNNCKVDDKSIRVKGKISSGNDKIAILPIIRTVSLK